MDRKDALMIDLQDIQPYHEENENLTSKREQEVSQAETDMQLQGDRENNGHES